MTATTDDLRELEAELDLVTEPAADAPAVPAYITAAERRRREDVERGFHRSFPALYAVLVAGLVLSLGVFGFVALDQAAAGSTTSSVSAP